DFHPILPSFSLPFSPHSFNHPILVKSTLLFYTKSGILGAQNPFPAAVLVKNSYFQLSPFFSFLPSFMVRSEEEKRWVYMLVRRVAPCAPISFGSLDVLLKYLFLPSQQPTWSSKLLRSFVFQPNAEAFAASYF
ncbi:unnamed protein product, partial [Prunus brigantina]